MNLPPIYSFPPFFTLQPNEHSRRTQLDHWCDLVSQWCNANKVSIIILNEWPLWENSSINRRLSPEGIRAVANHMISKGRAEWTDDTKASLRIYYKSPAEWSQIIYTHMAKLGYTGQIMTLHELHSGGPCVGTDFEGLESTTLLRAVEILELSNKASILRSGASTIDEYGVKFI